MSEEEKWEFLGNIKYFWFERGDLERYVGYTPEKLREADPVLANAYENLKLAQETFNRLMEGSEQSNQEGEQE